MRPLNLLWYGLSICATLSSARAQIRNLPDARVGQPYEYVVLFEGLVEPIEFDWGKALPPGLRAEGARLFGKPLEAKTVPYRIDVQIQDALEREFKANYALRVRPEISPLVLVTKSITTQVVGQPTRFECAARGGEGEHRWRASGEWPQGLRLDLGKAGERCVLLGVPTQIGDIRLEVRVRDALGELAPAVLRGRVGPPLGPELSLCTDELPAARYGAAYRERLCAQGGQPPYTWTLRWMGGTTPAGMRFDEKAGVLAGIPERLEHQTLDVTVRDAAGGLKRRKLTFVVAAPTRKPAKITVGGATVAVVGRPFVLRFALPGAVGDVDWQPEWKAKPAWAQWQHNDGDLMLRGTPSEPGGPWTLRLTARELDRPAADSTAKVIAIADAIECRVEAVLSRMPAPPPAIATSSLPVAIVGQPYSTELRASGGELPIRFVGSSLPARVTITQEGTVTATPAVAADAMLRIEVIDAKDRRGDPVNLRYRAVKLKHPLNVGNVGELVALARRALEYHLPISGGVPPYRVKLVSDAPAGLVVTATGQLTGRIDNARTHVLHFEVRDATEAMVPAEIRLAVLAPPSGELSLIALSVMLAAGALAFGTIIIYERLRRRLRRQLRAAVLDQEELVAANDHVSAERDEVVSKYENLLARIHRARQKTKKGS